MDRLLTTQEAAAMAGVGPTAIKRWADQGQLPCERTAGGHRRISEAALIAFLRRHSAPDEGEEHGFVDLLLQATSGHAIEAQLLTWRDRDGSWFSVAERVGVTLEEIGERWGRGDLSLLEEHAISERLHRALVRCADGIPVSPRAPEALLATVEGDDHVLGLALVELCLRAAGMRTRWAGRLVPAQELLRSIEVGEVDLLVISASSASTDDKRLLRYAQRVGAACVAAEVDLLLGGQGAWPEVPHHGTRLRTFAELREHLGERATRG